MSRTLAHDQKHGVLNLVSKYQTTLVLAFMLATLHFLFVAIPVFRSGGSGESQAFLVVCADAPLYLLIKAVMGDGMYSISRLQYVFIYSIGGTLMYALFGGLIGLVFDRIRRKSRNQST